MFRSEARVPTAKASRYIAALCKHFAHKISVEYDAAQGRADFPFGVCRLQADAETLIMLCEAPDADALARVESVVGVHLERFAWREKPVISWLPAPNEGPAATSEQGVG